jgi:hypothetical protein
MVDELRQARDAWQRQTGRGTRQTAIRWKQGLLRLGVVSSVLWIGLRRARWRIVISSAWGTAPAMTCAGDIAHRRGLFDGPSDPPYREAEYWR